MRASGRAQRARGLGKVWEVSGGAAHALLAKGWLGGGAPGRVGQGPSPPV